MGMIGFQGCADNTLSGRLRYHRLARYQGVALEQFNHHRLSFIKQPPYDWRIHVD